MVVSPRGETLARAAEFEPELLVCDMLLRAAEPAAEAAGVALIGPVETGAHAEGEGERRLAEPLEPEEREVYEALVTGVRDYVEKNGFECVVLGLSGGIDSALVALVAADALGPERVKLAVMPSPHSADETQADARAIAANLGAELVEIPIADLMGGLRAGARGALRGNESPALPRRTSRRGSGATWRWRSPTSSAGWS